MKRVARQRLRSDYLTGRADRLRAALRALDRAFDARLCRDQPTETSPIRPMWDGDQYIGGTRAAGNVRTEQHMALKYNPKDATTTWPDGDYDAEIVKVEEKQSSKGNDMAVVTYKVYNDEGKTRLVTDYIVIPAALFKLKQLAGALGQQAAFDAETFQPGDHVGAGVRVELRTEAGDGQYEDKNRINKVKAPAGAKPPAPTRRPAAPVAAKRAASPVAEEAQFEEADIPF